jgi:hypothetical protein
MSISSFNRVIYKLFALNLSLAKHFFVFLQVKLATVLVTCVFACVAYSSTPKMEAVDSFETSLISIRLQEVTSQMTVLFRLTLGTC